MNGGQHRTSMAPRQSSNHNYPKSRGHVRPHPSKSYSTTNSHHHRPPSHAEQMRLATLDWLLSADLENYLRSRGDVYESLDGEEQRRDTIEKLHTILCRWIDALSVSRGVPNPGNGAGAHLKIFGSTRLGVHTPDADIDVLCIAPSWISRQDFFSLFVDALRDRYDVSMVSAVPEAYTPVVKFVIDGQPVDMIFVSLPFHAVIPPDLDILSPSILRGLDDAAVRSINGSRVAERILTLVPHFPTFATTLRAVKFWAREHSVYSNVLGFLGGVNYAILVCKLCQMHPHAPPMTLLANFYSLYCQWPWPQCVAVAPYESIESANVGCSGEILPGAVRPGQDWTPLSSANRYQLMPILTPCYPSMNSSYNVGAPQFRVIYEELRRSAGVFQAWYRDNQSEHARFHAPMPSLPGMLGMAPPTAQAQSAKLSAPAGLELGLTGELPAPVGHTVLDAAGLAGMEMQSAGQQRAGGQAEPVHPPPPPPPPFRPIGTERGSTHDKENMESTIVTNICAPPPPSYSPFNFERLFKSDLGPDASTPAFFLKYPHYLEVSIQANSASDHRNWFGFIESRMRSLIINIEQPGLGLYTHPQSNCYHVVGVGKAERNAVLSASIASDGMSQEPALRKLESPFASPLKRSPSSSSSSSSSGNGGLRDTGSSAGARAALLTPTQQRAHSPADPEPDTFTTAFYIGITFNPAPGSQESPHLDTLVQESLHLDTLVLSSSAVLDLKYRISTWPALQPTNKIAFALLTYTQLPDYIHSNRPEPSNLQTCTPGKRGRETTRDEARGTGGLSATGMAEGGPAFAASASAGLFCDNDASSCSSSSSSNSSSNLGTAAGIEGGRSGALQFDLRSPTHLARRSSSDHDAHRDAPRKPACVALQGTNESYMSAGTATAEEGAYGAATEADLASRLGLGSSSSCGGGSHGGNKIAANVGVFAAEGGTCLVPSFAAGYVRSAAVSKLGGGGSGKAQSVSGTGPVSAAPRVRSKEKTKAGYGSSSSAAVTAQKEQNEKNYLARRFQGAGASQSTTSGHDKGEKVIAGGVRSGGGKVAWGTANFAQVVSGKH